MFTPTSTVHLISKYIGIIKVWEEQGLIAICELNNTLNKIFSTSIEYFTIQHCTDTKFFRQLELPVNIFFINVLTKVVQKNFQALVDQSIEDGKELILTKKHFPSSNNLLNEFWPHFTFIRASLHFAEVLQNDAIPEVTDAYVAKFIFLHCQVPLVALKKFGNQNKHGSLQCFTRLFQVNIKLLSKKQEQLQLELCTII